MRSLLCLLPLIAAIACSPENPQRAVGDVAVESLPDNGVLTVCWQTQVETDPFVVIDESETASRELQVEITSNPHVALVATLGQTGITPIGEDKYRIDPGGSITLRLVAKICFEEDVVVNLWFTERTIEEEDDPLVTSRTVTVRNNCPCEEPSPNEPLSCDANPKLTVGSVISPAGEPLADVTVECGGKQTKTDGDGRFFLLDATGILDVDERFISTIDHPGGTVDTHEIVVPTEFAASGSASIANDAVTTAVTIADFIHVNEGAPVTDPSNDDTVTISAQGIDPELLNVPLAAGTAALAAQWIDTDATFEFGVDVLVPDPGLAGGISLGYFVLDRTTGAWKRVSGSSVVREFDLLRVRNGVRGPGVYCVVVRFASKVTVEGCVTDPDGKPLAGVSVRSTTGARTVTDADGKYEFDVPILPTLQGGYFPFDLVYVPPTPSGRGVARATVDVTLPEVTIERDPVVLTGQALGWVASLVTDNLAAAAGANVDVEGEVVSTNDEGLALHRDVAAGAHSASVAGPFAGSCDTDVRDGFVRTIHFQQAGDGGPTKVTIIPHIVTDPLQPVTLVDFAEVRARSNGRWFGGRTNVHGAVRFCLSAPIEEVRVRSQVRLQSGETVELGGVFQRVTIRDGRLWLPLLAKLTELEFVPDETLTVCVENFTPPPAGEEVVAVAWDRATGKAISGEVPLDGDGKATIFGPSGRTAVALTWRKSGETTKVDVGTNPTPDELAALSLERLLRLDLDGLSDPLAAAFRFAVGASNVPFSLAPDQILVPTDEAIVARDVDTGLEVTFEDLRIVAGPVEKLPDMLPLKRKMNEPAYDFSLDGNRATLRFVPERTDCVYVFIYEDGSAKYVLHVVPPKDGSETVVEFDLPRDANRLFYAMSLVCQEFDSVANRTRTAIPHEAVWAAFAEFTNQTSTSMVSPVGLKDAFFREKLQDVITLSEAWYERANVGYYVYTESGNYREVIR